MCVPITATEQLLYDKFLLERTNGKIVSFLASYLKDVFSHKHETMATDPTNAKGTSSHYFRTLQKIKHNSPSRC